MFFIVSFFHASPKLSPSLFLSLSPSRLRRQQHARSGWCGPVGADCRASARILPGPAFLWHLSLTAPVVFFQGLTCGLRCSVTFLVWAGAFTVRPLSCAQVMLVHQRIESGEAGMFSWRILPVLEPRRSCSARFCRRGEPPFPSTCPLPGASSITRWFTLCQPFSWRQSFLPFHQPLAPAREVAYWYPVMRPRTRVRPRFRRSLGCEFQPTLEYASVTRSTSQAAGL
jgi:hypothetical protein